ncbi:hypothetical protein, partial [Salmonella enterica]|uniref:hypothetical protein n=1 Tax=Salmonella enterica TaxID=28901 RepID=UPI001CA429F9
CFLHFFIDLHCGWRMVFIKNTLTTPINNIVTDIDNLSKGELKNTYTNKRCLRTEETRNSLDKYAG